MKCCWPWWPTITFRTWTRQDGTSVDEVELRVSGFEREELSGLTEIPETAAWCSVLGYDAPRKLYG